MVLKIGQVGLGFMGKMHFETYGRLKNAKVVAICDVDRKKLSGDWSGIAGNIGAAGKKVNLKGIRLYTDLKAMLRDPEIDVVDITLPTYLHAGAAVAALAAGKHVVCEKPMAINSTEAAWMVNAAKKARRKLFIAHCIRFWPQYAVARDIVKSGKWGPVISACFRRFSTTPTWSWNNWLQDPAKSGVAALDLHVHDADYILYLLGKPRKVSARGAGLGKGRMDHIHATYDFGPGKLVTAEGGWEFAPGFPFSMTFSIAMKRATLNMGTDFVLNLHPLKGVTRVIPVPAGDGYGHELAHFVKCIAGNKASKVVSPESALQSVRLVEAEVRSARTGNPVRVSL